MVSKTCAAITAMLQNDQIFWYVTICRGVFPDVSKDRVAFVFRIKQYKTLSLRGMAVNDESGRMRKDSVLGCFEILNKYFIKGI